MNTDTSSTVQLMLEILCIWVVDPCLRACERPESVWTACFIWNFTKFTILLHMGTEMNWLDFEIKRSKGQGHNQTGCCQKSTFGTMWSSQNIKRLQLELIWMSYRRFYTAGQNEVKRSKVKDMTRPYRVKKTEAYASTPLRRILPSMSNFQMNRLPTCPIASNASAILWIIWSW